MVAELPVARDERSRGIGIAELPDRLSGARVIIIDGRSGSGKTQLADRLAERFGARVVHMDDLYAGWDGLGAGQRYLVETIITPLLQGRAARWQSWNWATDRRDRWHRIEPVERLIIEGCGSLTSQTLPLAQATVWLEAPEVVRRARARRRDGDDWWWEQWAGQELEHLRANHPESLAALLVDTDLAP
ncbi:cobalt ABC transporter [Naumannella halotolerans]|uniref:cobalt ABC transporter n=1 Tax=Naumannella halotolerans TaxID=993414 RepID=UPI00370D59D9